MVVVDGRPSRFGTQRRGQPIGSTGTRRFAPAGDDYRAQYVYFKLDWPFFALADPDGGAFVPP
jgi:hypothetical protein